MSERNEQSSSAIVQTDDGWYITAYGKTTDDLIREIKNTQTKVTVAQFSESLKAQKRASRAAKK